MQKSLPAMPFGSLEFFFSCFFAARLVLGHLKIPLGADSLAPRTFITNFTNQVMSSSTTLTPATNLTTAEMLTANFAVGDHFVDTAKVEKHDGTSVVDTNTKVRGTDNLFVVDAGIHPDLPTGNTQAIMVVAVKASQFTAAL